MEVRAVEDVVVNSGTVNLEEAKIKLHRPKRFRTARKMIPRLRPIRVNVEAKVEEVEAT